MRQDAGVTRFDLRLASAVCGIALCLGAAVLLRHVDWPGVWHWLRSPPGLYVQAGTAVTFQLAGVVLVVQDLRRDTKALAQLGSNISVIEAALRNIDVRELVREQYGDHVDDELTMLYGVPRAVTTLRLGATNLILRDLVAFQGAVRERVWWKRWLGPSLLVLGIAFSGSTDLLGIASPA